MTGVSMRWAAPSASICSARRVPTPWASPVGPETDWRTERTPSAERAIARIQSSSPSSPSTTSASAPTGRAAARLERREHGALGLDGGAGGRVVERGERRHQVGVGRAALDGQGALAGRGKHLERVEHLGDGVEPAEPREAGPGEQDRVEPVAHLAQPGVDVAADLDDLEPETERVQLRGAPRRAGADHAADRELPEGQAVASDHDVARVLARRHGRQGEARGGRGGQVLQRVHREVDPAVEERLAQGADEHAQTAETGQRRRAGVALGGDVDELDVATGLRADESGDLLALGAGQGRGAGAEAQASSRRLLPAS